MKKMFLLLIISICVMCILCGCEPDDNVDTPSNHTCIDCGQSATHYMGKKWVNYSTIDLYYCDSCYDKVIKEAEDNNRIVRDIWWE